MEGAGLEFHEAVRREFLDLAAADPQRFAVIDGTLPREEVHAQVLAAIAKGAEPVRPHLRAGPTHPAPGRAVTATELGTTTAPAGGA